MEKRVKDFTYYPLMSDTQCAFRIQNPRSIKAHHQCPRYSRREIEGYSFCEKHAAVVEKAVNNKQG